MKKEKNVVITGVGGQGILTFAGILARTALDQGYDVKASELHGLAMRFGSMEVHLRIGENLSSPLISIGKADIVVAQEPLEALRAAKYANKSTVFIMDTKKQVPVIYYIEKTPYPSIASIKSTLEKFSNKAIAVAASDETEKETGSTIMANMYLLGRLAAEGLLPFKKQAYIKIINQIVPESALNKNLKVFELGYSSLTHK